MTKTRYLPVITAITFLLLLLETNAYADVANDPIESTGGMLLIAAIIIGVLVIVTWLIIRSIRKKKKI